MYIFISNILLIPFDENVHTNYKTNRFSLTKYFFFRNSTKNTTQLGIVSSDVISGPMSLMKPGTLFTSIWAKWPSFYSRAARDKKIKTTV